MGRGGDNQVLFAIDQAVAPSEFLFSLTKEMNDILKKCFRSTQGLCGLASSVLGWKLICEGEDVMLEYGTYFLRYRHASLGHTWLESPSHIIDATRCQFEEGEMVIPLSAKQASLYEIKSHSSSRKPDERELKRELNAHYQETPHKAPKIIDFAKHYGLLHLLDQENN
jgi:hypothetical protein